MEAIAAFRKSGRALRLLAENRVFSALVENNRALDRDNMASNNSEAPVKILGKHHGAAGDLEGVVSH